MTMPKRFASALLLSACCTAAALACTSALIGAGRSLSGHALLWKHRDTGNVQNFIARVDASTPDELPYVGLFNAGDSLLREVWVGVNSAGFAVMNTASYNLAPDTARVRDREGLVMSRALRICRSVADFAALLDTLPRPLGVQANFGVIDSTGAGAYFETDDRGYVRFDLATDSLLLRTNFSCSGTCGAGLGLERYAAAEALLAHRRDISPALLTDTISRSFHPLPTGSRISVDDRGQYIPRYSTSASVVVEGTTLRVLPGYPPTSPQTYRVTLTDSIPSPLLPEPSRGWTAPAWRRAQKLRDAHFRVLRGGKIKHVTL